MQQKYRNIFTQKNYLPDKRTSVGRQIRLQDLCSDFTMHYSREMLAFYDVEFDLGNLKHVWLSKIFHRKKVVNPIKHLLVIKFLGFRVRDFLSTDFKLPELPIVGDGPWPCLNHICEKYKKLVIQNVDLSYDTGYEHKKRQSVNLTCPHCGYCYARRVLFAETDDKYRVGKVLDYGWLWHQRLANLWELEHASIQDLAEDLGVQVHTVIRRAIATGLSPHRKYRSVVKAFQRMQSGEVQLEEAQRDESYDITEVEWRCIEHLFPHQRKYSNRNAKDFRSSVNGILWKFGTGMAWDDLPSRYGKKVTVVARLTRWKKQGIWQKVIAILESKQ